MELKIKELRLRNFKGQRSFTMAPGNGVTSVHGTNASGKSTICDSWLWLWTGKDAKDRADYEVKTIGTNGDAEHHLEHSVCAAIEVDGITYDVERIYKEQWVKPTGEKDLVLKSHTTEFIWDTIPLTKKAEFEMRVNHLFGDAERFKLLSNPKYFLSIDWKRRRTLLMELAGATNENIMRQLAANNDDFAALVAELKNNTLDDFRKKLSADKKTLKKQIDEIPVKINEANLAIPEEPNYIEVEKIISNKEAELSAIDSQIADSSKAFEAQSSELKKIQSVILDKEMSAAKIESEAKTQANNLNSEEGKVLSDLQFEERSILAKVRALESDIISAVGRVNRKVSEIDDQERLLARLRDEYQKVNLRTLDEDSAVCPSCGQGLPSEEIGRLIANFNERKVADLSANVESGKRIASGIAGLRVEHNTLVLQKDEANQLLECQRNKHDLILASIQAEIDRPKQSYSYVDIIAKNENYSTILKEIEVLKLSLGETKLPDSSALTSKRGVINEEIHALRDRLAVRKIAEVQRQRISDLNTELNTLSSELSELEGKEFIADQFNRAKIEAIESGINGLFATIKWKMFAPLMNGGEEECCEALIDGKPYQTSNNAAQINAGIECINTLSKFYGMTLPIFIDNAESIVELTPSNSQILRFVVDGNYKQLIVID